MKIKAALPGLCLLIEAGGVADLRRLYRIESWYKG